MVREWFGVIFMDIFRIVYPLWTFLGLHVGGRSISLSIISF